METKSCSKCGETKLLDAFGRQSNGPLGRASWCKECKCKQVADRYVRDTEYRERTKAYSRARHKSNGARLAEYKLSKGCTDCGYNTHPAALEFDHLPQHVKCFTISKKTSYDWDRLQAEIDKCEVVCANCHAIRTALRR